MTDDIQQSTHSEEHKPTPFGARLKSARESLGFDRKEVAAQLRLNEKVILMMERDRYPADLPITFIRGYLRAYGKLLQIPEYEIKKAIEPIRPKPSALVATPILQPLPPPVTSGSYLMQLFTYLVILTMVGLVGAWWYTRPTSSLNPALLEPVAPPLTAVSNDSDEHATNPGTVPTAVKPAVSNTNQAQNAAAIRSRNAAPAETEISDAPSETQSSSAAPAHKTNNGPIQQNKNNISKNNQDNEEYAEPETTDERQSDAEGDTQE